jgi:hypothetical protein
MIRLSTTFSKAKGLAKVVNFDKYLTGSNCNEPKAEQTEQRRQAFIQLLRT